MAPSQMMIHRERLTTVARELSDYRILFVQAPAGYGKTVFAGQWLEGRKEPGAVVSLDEYDNSMEGLCHKLRAPLEELYSVREQVAALTRHPDFDKAPVEFLMRAAAALPGDSKAGIVIDDLHALKDVRAQKVLLDFLMRLPAGVRICILSRNHLPDIFSGQVLKQNLQFIPQELFLFNSSEICTLYQSKGIPLTAAQGERILTCTEGWPLGITALLLSEHQIPTETISVEWLDGFLKNRVWDMWEDRFQEFMIGTCMEDVLSESLCDALTGEIGSGRILEQMLMEGVFLSRQSDNTYRFHQLFGAFLRKQYQDMPEEYRRRQLLRAGAWYQEHDDFYHAVRRFADARDYDRVAECFDMLESMDRAVFDTEQIMQVVHDTLGEEVTRQYPFLYYMMAYTARSEGKINDFQKYADLYYANYPRIVQRNPELAHNIFFLYAMDSRYTLLEIAKMAKDSQVSETFQGVRGSATLYFPLYHRSFRDFSEMLPGDIDTGVAMLSQTLGMLLGEECGMLLDCVRSGLYYEQGDLQHARELALSAAAAMQGGFTPESKFCTMILLLTINHALQLTEQEGLIQRDIQNMIEADKTFYLQHSFDAVLCKNRLDFGDEDAAREWLSHKASNVYGVLGFFDLYGHFTTARAYITIGEFGNAIILLEKILEMGRVLKRPIDMIEAEILLSVAFWKIKRGNRKTAISHLEQAIRLAQPLEYTQVFANEGAEVAAMLSSIKNRTKRSDFEGDLSETFVNQLYIRTTELAHSGRGLTGGKPAQAVRLTPQQKRVATLMCEGYSYRKIAEELGVQFSTVRSHIELIYRKLEVSTMDEAIRKIRQLHILEDA